MNQTRAEEITMREDYGNINLETGKKNMSNIVLVPENPTFFSGAGFKLFWVVLQYKLCQSSPLYVYKFAGIDKFDTNAGTFFR